MNYSNPSMSYEENKKDLENHLDDVCSYLAMGEMWHRKAANECRKIALRGFGRWHEAESCGDGKSLMCLEKILMDKLMYSPMHDISMIDKAEKYTMNNLNDFKIHFKLWSDNEEKLIECLNNAIHLSRTIDIQIYNKLCCIVDEVQNEKMRVRMVYDRLELAGWNGHDLGVCSKWLHKYFECDYKQGDSIDFNLG